VGSLHLSRFLVLGAGCFLDVGESPLPTATIAETDCDGEAGEAPLRKITDGEGLGFTGGIIVL
jgi:hypothetical protein